MRKIIAVEPAIGANSEQRRVVSERRSVGIDCGDKLALTADAGSRIRVSEHGEPTTASVGVGTDTVRRRKILAIRGGRA